MSLTELPIGRPVGARLEQEIGLCDPEFRQHDLALNQLEQIDVGLDAVDRRHGRIAGPGHVAELDALDSDPGMQGQLNVQIAVDAERPVRTP